MWITKVSFEATEHATFARYAKQERINLSIFPLSWTYKKKDLILNIAGTFHGDEQSKRKFFKVLKKDKKSRLINIEFSEDFFIASVKEYAEAKTVYNEKIIYTQPIQINQDGIITYALSAFNKKDLEKALKTFEKFYKIKIHYLKKEKPKNISFKSSSPDLTEKQKQAINLAISQGYYEYPRKTSIQKLAKTTKRSFTTFHSHLRKAEQKLLPFSHTQQ
jgi:predicted DNA binding protein